MTTHLIFKYKYDIHYNLFFLTYCRYFVIFLISIRYLKPHEPVREERSVLCILTLISHRKKKSHSNKVIRFIYPLITNILLRLMEIK